METVVDGHYGERNIGRNANAPISRQKPRAEYSTTLMTLQTRFLPGMYIGIDGCSCGWFAVKYDEGGYQDSRRFKSINELWNGWGTSAETVLVDIPIGLRESSSNPRPCDTAARAKLGQPRQSSVFPTPIREAVHADSYEEAKAIQERKTDDSLGTQSWGIADKIAEVDDFLEEANPEVVETLQEAHPEVCFWALAGEAPMDYSKRSQPAAAFWERVDTLETVDSDIVSHVRDTAADLNAKVGNDDIIDAFALAVTASPLTSEPLILPENPTSTDPRGLPMRITYTYSEGSASQ